MPRCQWQEQSCPSIPAWSFCHLTLISRKSKTYPSLEECRTLGDPIRRRRLEPGLLQRDVALLLGITSSTLGNWEKGGNEPEVESHPAILTFLGYRPCQRVETRGQWIMSHHTHRGLSQTALARAIGVDPGSISRWENGERAPMKSSIWKLRIYFQSPSL